MAKGDWEAYGKAQDKLSDALNRAIAAQEELGQTVPTTSPSDGGEG